MCTAILHILILLTLNCQSSAENKKEITATCPWYQRAFRSSCFEFVGLELSFYSAQHWCEERGGHLAFIPNKDAQYFLERHLDSENDMWLGLAPSSSSNQQNSGNVEGLLSWLDGSPVTYSKWLSSPQPGAACANIVRNSGFQWKATGNCNKKMHFICQFASGRRIVCSGHNTTLQCSSGQMLIIDGGFYGRKNINFCRSRFSSLTSTKDECGWIDVVDSIKAHCQGRQVCQIAEVMKSFGELCPPTRSYLAVHYHCKEGLALSMKNMSAVSDDVIIRVKWLAQLPQETLVCMLNTGDGHIFHLHSPDGLESSMVYKYTHQNTFVVAVECTSSNIHIKAQKIITIQQPVTEIGVIKCYSGNMSFCETNCKALYEGAFQIQLEVKAGTNVVYRIQRSDNLLAGMSAVQGNIPLNITVTTEMVQELGPGCHNLTLSAFNMITFPEVSRDLQVNQQHT
ncbi:polycystin-1-like protein 2 [Leuresthes tenuis]|uniref:polycystin-1-like protein 2 n=1 Tax=Leuresthes tenuis TaxID=355514 RepID=UPI003B506452